MRDVRDINRSAPHQFATQVCMPKHPNHAPEQLLTPFAMIVYHHLLGANARGEGSGEAKAGPLPTP